MLEDKEGMESGPDCGKKNQQPQNPKDLVNAYQRLLLNIHILRLFLIPEPIPFKNMHAKTHSLRNHPFVMSQKGEPGPPDVSLCPKPVWLLGNV